MKIQPTFLSFSRLAAAVVLFSACRTHGPAFSATTDPYMAKPAYRGEDEGAFYLSARLNRGYEYYVDENNQSTELAGHVSYMYEHFYFSGGFFGYWGKYKVNGAVSPVTGAGVQDFNGGGFRLEMGGRLPLEDNFDVLLGVHGEMFAEGGEFAKNSRDAFSDVITLGLSRLYINLAPAFDLRFAPAGKWDIGMRYSLDAYISFSDLINNDKRSYLHRLTLHTTIDRVTAYGQIGFTPDEQRVFSLGMTYGIPFKEPEKEPKI